MRISDIKIGKRLRPLGDVSSLVESMREVGLLQPITVTTGGVLVAGRHRLEAAKLLGWKEIEARSVDLDGLRRELGEIDENLVRNELTVLERSEHLGRRKEIYEAIHPTAKHGGDKRSAKAKNQNETISPRSFADDTAKKTGLSGRTIQHEVQIAQKIAPDVKEKLRGTPVADSKSDLLKFARMNETDQRAAAGKIASGEASSARAASNLATAARVRAEPAPLPEGPFRVIVADPPWQYDKRAEDATHRGANPYPSMTTDQICALPVGARAHDDAVLWLWTTNAFMRDAFRVLDAWGFKEKTILTWVKDRMGMGDWLRGQTEHCLMAVRGKPVVTLTNQTTVLDARLREHSRKPDEFYALVEKLCHGSKLEIFAREARAGWDVWGAETAKFAPTG